jgi:hypothetical protein
MHWFDLPEKTTTTPSEYWLKKKRHAALNATVIRAPAPGAAFAAIEAVKDIR